MYSNKQKLLSQNFLCNRQLVSQLVRLSSVGKNDTVLEIGAGNGIITQDLVRVAKKVIAVEIDSNHFHTLQSRLSHHSNLELVHSNFLNLSLPTKPYKVFSNLPFRITAHVIRKLIFSSAPLLEAYLIIQKEATDKLIPKTKHNSLLALLFYPWYEFKIVHQFSRSDFIPKPNVDSVLLKIVRRQTPLISPNQRENFQDYIAHQFNKNRLAKFVSPQSWLIKFMQEQNQTCHKGYFTKLIIEQSKLQKIHRTRKDKNWKRFKPGH